MRTVLSRPGYFRIRANSRCVAVPGLHPPGSGQRRRGDPPCASASPPAHSHGPAPAGHGRDRGPESMELIADRDPEEARKTLDPVVGHMMDAVHHYEGTVNQVMGD